MIERDLIAALRYYGSPNTYRKVRAMVDSPAGDFGYDLSEVDGRDSCGDVARHALAAVGALLGADLLCGVASVEPDRELMERLGIDVELRYNPPRPQPGDKGYREREAGCGCRSDMVDGRVDLRTDEAGQPIMPDECPFCEAPVDEHGLHLEEGEVSYICRLDLLPCGHYDYGFFSGDVSCQLIRSRRAALADR